MPRSKQVDPLARVKRAHLNSEKASRQYREALLAAVAEGHSFADIAKAAGTSRQNVRQIIGRDR